MFSGAKINITEGRSVLHIALRNRNGRPIIVDGVNQTPLVDAVLAKMRGFVENVRHALPSLFFCNTMCMCVLDRGLASLASP